MKGMIGIIETNAQEIRQRKYLEILVGIVDIVVWLSLQQSAAQWKAKIVKHKRNTKPSMQCKQNSGGHSAWLCGAAAAFAKWWIKTKRKTKRKPKNQPLSGPMSGASYPACVCLKCLAFVARREEEPHPLRTGAIGDLTLSLATVFLMVRAVCVLRDHRSCRCSWRWWLWAIICHMIGWY